MHIVYDILIKEIPLIRLNVLIVDVLHSSRSKSCPLYFVTLIASINQLYVSEIMSTHQRNSFDVQVEI